MSPLFRPGGHCVFGIDPSVTAERAFEVPDTEGVRRRGLVTASQGDTGTIADVANLESCP